MGCGWVFNDVWRDSGYGKNVLVSYLGLVVGGLVFMIYDHDGDIEWFFFLLPFWPNVWILLSYNNLSSVHSLCHFILRIVCDFMSRR